MESGALGLNLGIAYAGTIIGLKVIFHHSTGVKGKSKKKTEIGVKKYRKNNKEKTKKRINKEFALKKGRRKRETEEKKTLYKPKTQR